jgi:uncharacterized Zn finger protein (UPF0148 family)
MMIIECVQCGNPKVENNGLCASCAHALRKAERKVIKEKEPINKVSDKRGKELNQYANIRKKFLLNRWCQMHGQPCLPTEIHHAKGRTGVDENGVPMLLVVKYFVPVCAEAHRQIEEHPKWAKENGYSESRLI